jgi:hypothetical protein
MMSDMIAALNAVGARRAELTKQLEGITAADYEALSDLESALQSNEEACLAAFGDHVEVTVTRDGIEVEEYSHD